MGETKNQRQKLTLTLEKKSPPSVVRRLPSVVRRFTGKDRVGAAGLVLFVGIAILPIGFSLCYAAAYSVGAVGLLSDGLTAVHWAVLLEETEIWAAFGWSLYVAALTVTITVGAALVLALYLRQPLTHGPLSYIIYFPLALPGTVAAFLIFQVFSGAGYASRVALKLGLVETASAFPGFVNDAWGIGIVAAHVSIAAPFFMLLFVQVYDGERVGELTRLAGTLGAGRGQQLFRVAVPILLKKSLTNIVLLFIAVLGSYEIPLLLGRQSPQMVSVLTMRKYQLFDLADKPEAFIVALLYTALVLALITAVFRKGGQTYDL